MQKLGADMGDYERKHFTFCKKYWKREVEFAMRILKNRYASLKDKSIAARWLCKHGFGADVK